MIEQNVIGGGIARRFKMTPPSQTIGVSLPVDVLDAAKEMAEEEHRTLSNLIAHVLSSYIEEKERASE